MKANELMLGDLVLDTRTNRPLRVNPFMAEMEVPEWEPIPLTPEILEKNGFGGNKPKVKLILEDTRELLYHIYEKTLTVYWNRQIVFRSPCAYIHQLQHALRLCGINKEIEL